MGITKVLIINTVGSKVPATFDFFQTLYYCFSFTYAPVILYRENEISKSTVQLRCPATCPAKAARFFCLNMAEPRNLVQPFMFGYNMMVITMGSVSITLWIYIWVFVIPLVLICQVCVNN